MIQIYICEDQEKQLLYFKRIIEKYITNTHKDAKWIFLCGNTASPADGEPSVRTSGNRSCEFTRVMFCLSHIPHASKCHVQHQCL